MNKAFRTYWSKVRQQCVIVSKATSSVSHGNAKKKAVVSAVIGAMFLMGGG